MEKQKLTEIKKMIINFNMYRQVHGYNTCNSSRFYIRAVASKWQLQVL